MTHLEFILKAQTKFQLHTNVVIALPASSNINYSNSALVVYDINNTLWFNHVFSL